MKFEKYINESSMLQNFKHPREIIDIVKKDCGPFVKEAHKFFYRGLVNRASIQITKMKPRQDRLPSNTPSWIHKQLDDWFNDRFGWRARSTGVFAAGDYFFASAFSSAGQTVLFFPIGNYKYVYSRDIIDLYDNLDDIYNGEDVFEYMDSKNYTQANLNKAGNSEIVFQCKAYYAINIVYIPWLAKEFGISMAGTPKHLLNPAIREWGNP